MEIIIDRIENDCVIAELAAGELLTLPRQLFPDAAEGDVYILKKDGAGQQARRQRIKEKMDRLFRD